MVNYKIIASTMVLGVTGIESFCQPRKTPLHRARATSLEAVGSNKNKSDVKSKTSKEGAGSWRAKAKEFLKQDNIDASDMKLNIAFVTGNAMKQKEINLILSQHGATAGLDGESYVNLRILDVDLPEIQGECVEYFCTTLEKIQLLTSSASVLFVEINTGTFVSGVRWNSILDAFKISYLI